jgi:hypothetical protein
VLLTSIRNWLYLRVYLPIFWSHRGKNSKNSLSLSALFLKLFPSPRPHHTKMKVLRRFGGSKAWIETGTYFGDGALAISEFAQVLHTIEPSENLSEIALNRVKVKSNIYLHVGTSESLLPRILETLIQDGYKDLSLWLDGHYSGGETFLGSLETPIISELETLRRYSNSFPKMSIIIDDLRCFNPKISEYRMYPEIQYLLDYAKAQRLKLLLTRDICIMTSK